MSREVRLCPGPAVRLGRPLRPWAPARPTAAIHQGDEEGRVALTPSSRCGSPAPLGAVAALACYF